MYNQDPCPSVSENAVFRKYAEFQYNFHLRSLIAPRSREESRSTRRDMQSAPVEAAVTALDDGLRLLCAACACLQGGRCALLSAAHRPGPMSSRAVKRTGSCCATPRAGGAARRRSVRQRGGDAQTHDGCVQALLLATRPPRPSPDPTRDLPLWYRNPGRIPVGFRSIPEHSQKFPYNQWS